MEISIGYDFFDVLCSWKPHNFSVWHNKSKLLWSTFKNKEPKIQPIIQCIFTACKDNNDNKTVIVLCSIVESSVASSFVVFHWFFSIVFVSFWDKTNNCWTLCKTTKLEFHTLHPYNLCNFKMDKYILSMMTKWVTRNFNLTVTSLRRLTETFFGNVL